MQRPDHFKAGAIAYVTEPAEAVPAEGTLQDLPVLGAIKQCSPLFQFPHALRSFLGVELRHAPVVEQLTAAHGVAKVGAPVVGGVHVGHGRRDPPLCHDGVGFAEERFANHADVGAFGQGSQGGSQAGAAGADDQYIVVVGLEFSHMSLRSVIVPLATKRI